MRSISFIAFILTLLFLYGTQITQAGVIVNDKVEICHIPPTPNQTADASGHVIEISRHACVAHCTNHGGDHVIGDGACAFAFPGGDDCIVNSFNPGLCSVNRCIDNCETLIP